MYYIDLRVFTINSISHVCKKETKVCRNFESCYCQLRHYHCMKSVGIRSFFGPYFPDFGLNTERYGVCLHIQSERGKILSSKILNTDTFHTVRT